MESQYSIRGDAIDALHAHVAVLDDAGRIIAVNRRWRRFGRQNGAKSDYVGANYFAACDDLVSAGDRGAIRVVNGLRRLMQQGTNNFGMVYNSGARTFRLRALRVNDQPLRILVAHEDITLLLKARRKLEDANAGIARVRTQHAALVAEAHEELGQRLAAIGLATVALERAGVSNAALATIRLAVDEARREVRKLRYEAELDEVGRSG